MPLALPRGTLIDLALPSEVVKASPAAAALAAAVSQAKWRSALGVHEGTVNSAAFSLDGSRIVTASWDKAAIPPLLDTFATQLVLPAARVAPVVHRAGEVALRHHRMETVAQRHSHPQEPAATGLITDVRLIRHDLEGGLGTRRSEARASARMRQGRRLGWGVATFRPLWGGFSHRKTCNYH
jgi:hypothetical protein